MGEGVVMKPNINFLRKRAAGEVGPTFHYSARSGGVYGFRGGRVTYEKHLAAGYVGHALGASIGRPGSVPLTSKGIDAIRAFDSVTHKPRAAE